MTIVKGLKGTKLAMTRAGSATDLALRALLRDAGLEPDRDVAVIPVGRSNSAAAALRADQIDGFISGEPGGAVIVHQLEIGRYFIEPLRDQGPKFLQDMTFPTLQASDRYIQGNPQTAERVVRAVAKTQKRLREDPDAGGRVAQKFFATPTSSCSAPSSCGSGPRIFSRSGRTRCARSINSRSRRAW